MINIKDVVKIHDILIEEFGGAKGIRDKSLLESALSRPFQTFDRKELYPDVYTKAAALIESILINHPFIDGNKRIGYVLLRLILMNANLDLKASQDEKYDFVIGITKGNLKFDKIVNWIKSHSQKLI